jgi:transposase InsO family protein
VKRNHHRRSERRRTWGADDWASGTYRDPSGQRSPRITQDGGALTIDHDRTTTNLAGDLIAGTPRFGLMLGPALWSGMGFSAFVTDVYSQRIVGWRTAARMPTELPLEALEMALWVRERAGQQAGSGLVHHSDAGSQPRFKGVEATPASWNESR